MKWEISIPVVPMAKQSFRYGINKKSGKIIRYQPKDKVNYVGILKTYAVDKRPNRLLDGALRLSVVFYFPYLKSHSKKFRESGIQYKVTKPDIDNLLKPVKDALTGIVYADDNQIVEYGLVRKVYSDSGRIDIIVEELMPA